MVRGIYFIEMPYSDFRQFKGRPVLVTKSIDKNDVLILPLTTNLSREGITITNDDLEEGSLKKPSVIIVPKITAIDRLLIQEARRIAVLSPQSFERVEEMICREFGC